MVPIQVSDARLRRISLALALGLLIGGVFYIFAGNRPQSAFFRGDFPAFFAAAEIVWSGQGTQLYDFALQRERENHHWPDFDGEYYIFAYPPFFALLLSPLAALPPLLAKGLASLLLFAALIGALRLARGTSPFIRQHFAFTLIYLLSFGPLLISIAGVQNTALSILCFALLFHARANHRPWLSGLSAALLLYKPQFGVPLLFFLLMRGDRKELLGWLLGALALYLLGTLVQGPAWPLTWLRAATRFGDYNFIINGHQMISLAGLLYWFVESAGGEGASALPWAYLVAGGLLLVAAKYLRGDDRRQALAPGLVLLLSPQTLFYDVAIALFFLIQDLRPGNGRDFLPLAAIWLYALLALLLRDMQSFPLFNPLLVAVLWWHNRLVSDLGTAALIEPVTITKERARGDHEQLNLPP